MTTALRDRPAQAGTGNGGVPARRAVARWAWRLFRREWRQQLLVLGLLTAAVAAAIIGTAVATSTPPSSQATFGTASHLVTFPGTVPHLGAGLAAMRQHFGSIDVIEQQPFATGSVQGAQLRAQNPHGPFGGPMLALTSGRYPAGPGEVAVTGQLATLYDLHIGSRWHAAGRSWRVTGLVENPGNLLEQFALVAPGQLRAPATVTVLFDATPQSLGSFRFPAGVSPLSPGANAGFNPAVVVLAIDVFGLILIGLVAVAGFSVIAQRRLRALGMLSSLGATDRDVRLVMIVNGAVAGVTGTLAGAVLGLAGWFAYAPRLQAGTGHRVDPLHLPWWAIAAELALAIVTPVLAARRPARAVARMAVVTALAGRPALPKAVHRSAVPGFILLAAGLVLVAFGNGGGNGGKSPATTIGGIIGLTSALLLLAPLSIGMLAVIGRRAPVGVRLALRDLARYRSRSGAALGAISFAVFLAVLTAVAATARYANPVDYFGPNLPASQLIVYTPYGAVTSGHGAGLGVGPIGPGGPGASPGPGTARGLRVRVDTIAASLGTRNVLPLMSAVNPHAGGAGAIVAQTTASGSMEANTLYVATPALLRHYRISPGGISPATDILTSRPGLAGLPGLELFSGQPRPGMFGSCPGPTCVTSPPVQRLSELPTDISDPNLLLTTGALQRLGLREVTSGWLIQAARPLTAAQINTARQLASAAGGIIETRSQNPSLSELRNGSTVAALLIALGVLAMTVGLIRSEAGPDLRTLTATGASPGTRRRITATTAGALGLLGGLLGTVFAYLAALAWYRSELSTTITHVPAADLIAVIAGLPLAATVTGWLVAGREPPAIARQPLD